MFTPYETQEAFLDQDVYEDTHYSLCVIEEAIDLGGDWLLGLRSVDDDGRVYGIVEYYKLSEIRLVKFDNDQDIELFNKEEGAI